MRSRGWKESNNWFKENPGIHRNQTEYFDSIPKQLTTEELAKNFNLPSENDIINSVVKNVKGAKCYEYN